MLCDLMILKNGYGDDSVTVQSERVQITLALP